MSIEGTIRGDMAAALKAGDKDRLMTLRTVRAALQNAAIEAGVDTLDDDAAREVLRRQAKQRRDAIDAFEQGAREDLAASERRELEIIASYLPAPIGEGQIEAAAREKILAVGATGPQDMGKVMGPLMAELGADADGQAVSRIVRALLAEQSAE